MAGTMHFRAQPQMLEGHTVEDDGRSWTMTLREGLRFHDGEPVRARDVVASLRRWGRATSSGWPSWRRWTTSRRRRTASCACASSAPFPLLPDALGKVGANVAFIMPERLASTDPSTADHRDGRQRPLPLRGRRTRAGLARRLSRAPRATCRGPAAPPACSPAPRSRISTASSGSRHAGCRHRRRGAAAAARWTGGSSRRRTCCPRCSARAALKTDILDPTGAIGDAALQPPPPALRQPRDPPRRARRDQPGRFHDGGRRHRPLALARRGGLLHAGLASWRATRGSERSTGPRDIAASPPRAGAGRLQGREGAADRRPPTSRRSTR